MRGFIAPPGKWELGDGKMLGKLSGFKSQHRSHGEPVTVFLFQAALLTPVSPRSSICRDLETIPPKSGLNYRLRLTESHTTPSSLCFHTAALGRTRQLQLRVEVLQDVRPPQQSSLSLLQPEGPPHIRINVATLFRESAGSRCCADPIISTSDGLPGS